MIRRLASVSCLLLACTILPAADWCVDDSNTTGTEDGTPAAPFATVAAAMAVADDGDRLLIAAGTYTGPIRVDSRRVDLLGGHPGATSAAYMSGGSGNFTDRNPAANESTITGTPADSVILLIQAEGTVVDGLTLTGGGGANEDAFRSQGGGVYIDGGNPTVSNCRIHGNDAHDAKLESFGGGIHTTNSNSTISGCVIENNTAGRGGGISVSGGSPRIIGNTIASNTGTGDHGGGIYAFSEDVLIEGNIVEDNEVGRELGYGWGGGILVFNPGAVAVIRSNVVRGNYSPSRGPGIFIDDGATATISHCLVYNNPSEMDVGAGAIYVDGDGSGGSSHATIEHCTVFGHAKEEPGLGGNGLFVESNSTATVVNSIFWGNAGHSLYATPDSTITASYSIIEHAHAGEGLLQVDPLFANAGVGDFHLQSTQGRWNATTSSWTFDAQDSPAIDAGDPASPFDLEPPGNGGRANLGAFGNTAQASRTMNPDGAPSSWVIY